jgi:DNA-binding response OmpR family regulator
MNPPDVLLLRWPAEDHLRPERSGLARPTVLVIERGGPVPTTIGPFEDWVFDDAPPEEVALRLRLLSARTSQLDVGPLIDDGLLRHRGRWVALSDSQIPVVRLLIDELDRIVPLEALADAYASAGGSTTPTSIRTLLHRLTRRLAQVDLVVHTVRGRGAVLRPA